MWPQIERVERLDSEEIVTGLQIPPESQWFSGHFPGRPILPGIAQLALVRDAIGLARGGPVDVSEFRRVKFKKMITPGQFFKITVAPKKESDNHYSFRILSDNEVVCSGHLTVKPKNRQPKTKFNDLRKDENDP